MSFSNITTVDPHAHHKMDAGQVHGGHGGHSGGHGGHSGGHGNMMMQMYFHAGTNEVVLFSIWKISEWKGMLGSCILVFVMALFYEALKVLREYLLRKAHLHNEGFKNATEMSLIEGNNEKHNIKKMCSGSHLLQTVLHLLQVVTSYFLMLIFMTYNVYLCVALALGAGAGYFFFSWRRNIVQDINEHCH